MESYEGFASKPQIEVTDNAFKITLPNTNETTARALLSENESAALDCLNIT